MVVETLRDYLENGNIRHSVNFPEAALPRISGTERIAVANSNVPNMVGRYRPSGRGRAKHCGAFESLARRLRLHVDRY